MKNRHVRVRICRRLMYLLWKLNLSNLTYYPDYEAYVERWEKRRLGG